MRRRVSANIRPFRVFQLPFQKLIPLPGEIPDVVSALPFLVEPHHLNDVVDGGDMPAPIALLLDGPEQLVALKGRLDIIGRDNRDVAAFGELDDFRAHYRPSSTMVRLPMPDASLLNAAICWPGEMRYVIGTFGNSIGLVVE